jgi:hypothetical protein
MVKTQKIPAEIQRSVLDMTARLGLSEASKTLGLSEKTTLRIGAGVPVTAGTIAIVRLAVDSNKK